MTSAASAPGARPLIDRVGEPFERRYVAEDDGSRIAYVERGLGPHAVVLVHGTLTTLDDMLLALGPTLASQRLIAIDRPGYGFSDRRAGEDAGLFRQAACLNAVLDKLDVSSVVLVGHSFGASVAIAMALLAPERTRGVVALAPLAWPEWRLEHVLFAPRATPIFGGIAARSLHGGFDRLVLPVLWRGMFLPQAMPAGVERAFPFAEAGEAGATVHVGEDSCAVGADLVRLLLQVAMLKAPLHVLAGTCDLVVNNALHGQTLAALAPRGSMTWLAGVGHMAHHAAPHRVAEAVLAFDDP